MIQSIGVIDWEFAGVGLPAEDWGLSHYAINHLFPGEDSKAFWDGYGLTPDEKTLKQFYLGTAMTWLAKIDLSTYQAMGEGNFFSDVVNFTKNVLQE